jgi:hypothetical protein
MAVHGFGCSIIVLYNEGRPCAVEREQHQSGWQSLPLSYPMLSAWPDNHPIPAPPLPAQNFYQAEIRNNEVWITRLPQPGEALSRLRQRLVGSLLDTARTFVRKVRAVRAPALPQLPDVEAVARRVSSRRLTTELFEAE